MMLSKEKETNIATTLEETNKAIIRKFIEAYNSRNLDIFEELVVPDYMDHTHQTQERI
ncbi:MAG: hypothetical protein P8Y23_08055 [Candidatus Lokiarchaeota archaeon]